MFCSRAAPYGVVLSGKRIRPYDVTPVYEAQSRKALEIYVRFGRGRDSMSFSMAEETTHQSIICCVVSLYALAAVFQLRNTLCSTVL